MPNREVYNFVESVTPGIIGIDAPPNEQFGRDLERACLEPYWNKSLGVWFFDKRDLWKVQALLDKYFPDDTLKNVISLAWENIDGAHHKQWIIDQLLRVILKEDYESQKPDGWDTGIEP